MLGNISTISMPKPRPVVPNFESELNSDKNERNEYNGYNDSLQF